MDNYEPGVYTEKVLEATKLLSNTGKAALPGPRVHAASKRVGKRIAVCP